MDLLWMPEERRFVGTEKEAKKAKRAFEKHSVPTTKAELIEYLNGVEAGHEERLAAATGGGDVEPDADETAVASAEAVRPADGGSIVDRILAMTPGELAPVLSAAIGRLGEVSGTHGWAAFGKSVYGWTAGSRSVEQGLGMLMLAAMDTLGGGRPPKTRPIAAENDAGGE